MESSSELKFASIDRRQRAAASDQKARWIAAFSLTLLINIGMISVKSASAAPVTAMPIDFERDVQPLLGRACVQCHARGQAKGGLSIETRASILAGGESGPAAIPGKSQESLLIRLVSGAEPQRVMPAKGPRLSAVEIDRLRAWIDAGLPWPEGFTFGFRRASLAPRRPALPLPVSPLTNPIDCFLQPYYTTHHLEPPALVADARFLRRVSLDLVGLLPAPRDLDAFERLDPDNRRARVIAELLGQRRAYADHWLTFWNDALRNDYQGTGFIDGGRTQITHWLYQALYDNLPYDQFVRELIRPAAGANGFIKGIVWRGVVNASQRPEMQAAQNLSQVFLGTNLKCASCHDSFVNYWKLSDAYGLAAVFAEGPLAIHRCDRPTGKTAAVRFVYPELGQIDPQAPRTERLRQLAALVTHPNNGRFARTVVNRLWAWFFGAGLVEPVDDMDQAPWHADLLDWLAADFVDHGYDLQRTMTLICTSRAYQAVAVPAPRPGQAPRPFQGPLVRRLTAEEFADAVSAVTGAWQTTAPAMLKIDGRGQGGQLDAVEQVLKRPQPRGRTAPLPGSSATGRTTIRAALAPADPLTTALGRPNREQVVTRRDSLATTLQAVELSHGLTLDQLLKRGAANWLKRSPAAPESMIGNLYRSALQRSPTAVELQAARELLGPSMKPEGMEDLLWAVFMLPEFQLIE